MPTARLLINDNVPNPAQQRGVARYAAKLIEAAAGHFGPAVIICTPERLAGGAARHLRTPRLAGRYRLKVWLQDAAASAAARLAGVRLIHSLYYGNVRAPARETFTVYDLIYELFPQYFPREDWIVRRVIAEKRRCFGRAAGLLAISASAAADVPRCYPDLAGVPVAVTPLGVDAHFFEPAAAPASGGRPYFVYVGQRGGYKNFLRLLEAFGKSGLARSHDLRVLTSGPGAWTAAEQALIREYALERCVVWAQAAGDEPLRAQYAGAQALVYPSEYEGFGLPVLEALASGTVVVAAAAAALPAVGGPAALYVDPVRVDDIAAGLQRAAALAPAERAERLRLGRAHARTFTWEACQAKTLQAWETWL